MTGDNGPDRRPQVSVITIFWNEERFLGQAIESVLAQDGVDWELLLVDDGSTDASATIARRYVGAAPDRIRYLTHPGGGNRGMSAARNLGIAEAGGRWLTFLDADDVWEEGKLLAQLDALDRHPGVEVLVSPARWWYDQPGDDQPDADPGRGDWTQPLGPAGRGEAVVDPPGLLVDFLEDEWRSICDLVIGREAVAAVGGYEPMFRSMYEDQAFHAKVLARFPALVTEDSWYRYRQHAEACTAASHRAGSHLAARRRYLRWLARHLAEADDVADPGHDLAALVRSQRRLIRHPRLTRLVGRVTARIRTAIAGP